jgi:hypothetical protein
MMLPHRHSPSNNHGSSSSSLSSNTHIISVKSVSAVEPAAIAYPSASSLKLPEAVPLVSYNGRNGHHKGSSNSNANSYPYAQPGGQYYSPGQYPSPYTSESSVNDNGKGSIDSWFSISPLKLFVLWITVVLVVSAYITWRMYYPESKILPQFCCTNSI